MVLRSSLLAWSRASRVLTVAVGLATALLGGDGHRPALAQSNDVLRIVVPTTAGGPIDVMARLLAEKLSLRRGQTIIIDNRPGAGTTIGAKAVAKAAPDGNTLLFTTNSHVVSAAMYSSLDYDALKDFAPVAMVATGSWVLITSPDLKVNSVSQLVTYAKANPGKLNFGFTAGTAPQLVVELFKKTTGTNIINISYKGMPQVISDILGGRVQLSFTSTAGIQPLIESGKLRVLAVTGATRDPNLPNVLTMAESGYPDLTLNFWIAVLAPAGTPASVIAKLNEDINAGLGFPETKAHMDQLGFQLAKESPGSFATFLARDAATWKMIADSANLRIN